MSFVNSSSLVGGSAALYKGNGRVEVCVFRSGDTKGTLIHTETFTTVAAAKAWRQNTAQALLNNRKMGA